VFFIRDHRPDPVFVAWIRAFVFLFTLFPSQGPWYRLHGCGWLGEPKPLITPNPASDLRQSVNERLKFDLDQ